MEFQKIVNFIDTTSDDKDLPRFVTKKCMKVYDHSEKNYNIDSEMRIKTSVLISDLCNYCNAYIVVKGTIAVTAPDDAKKIKQWHLSTVFQKFMAYKLITQRT